MPKSPQCRNDVLSEKEVARLFDHMAEEYDEIRDLWYSWLLSRLHYLILTFLFQIERRTVRRCLDVGCGTGFQTLLLSLCGKNTIGIDISSALVAVARAKDISTYLEERGLFFSPFSFVSQYDRLLRQIAFSIRDGKSLGQVNYQVASATALPFRDGEFDLVNCCGSTLSFIDKYGIALAEMARVLCPGGYLVLEVENKYNMDLIWPVIDSFLADLIGFNQTLSISLANLFSSPRRHIKTDFPFSTHQGEVDMKIWLFSSRTLQHELELLGFKVIRIAAIHCVTNLLPSVVLDNPTPGYFIQAVFRLLSRIERHVGSLPILRRLGCSAVYFCVKQG